LRTEQINNVGITYDGGFMGRHWNHFIADECGALLVSDWIFLATILVLAVIPNMQRLPNQSNSRGFEEIRSKKPAALTISNAR
jgi:hypothetical protein